MVRQKAPVTFAQGRLHLPPDKGEWPVMKTRDRTGWRQLGQQRALICKEVLGHWIGWDRNMSLSLLTAACAELPLSAGLCPCHCWLRHVQSYRCQQGHVPVTADCGMCRVTAVSRVMSLSLLTEACAELPLSAGTCLCHCWLRHVQLPLSAGTCPCHCWLRHV
jgi:hypothetical protein